MPSLITKILRLERKCFPKGVRWERDTLTKALGKYEFRYITTCGVPVEVGGDIAAFIAIQHKGDHSYIQTIDVEPSYRGQGFATRLIKQAELEAAEAGALTMKLHVAVDNPAQTLYFRLGYRTVNFHRNFYDDAKHTAALEMHKPLSPDKKVTSTK